MAGHRRTRTPGHVHPIAAAGRAARIRERALARYAEAQDVFDRIAVGKDLVIAAAKAARRADPDLVARVLADLDQAQRRAADTLLDLAAKRRAS